MLRSTNKDYWNNAAEENACFHVASSRSDWNLEDFLRDGKWRFAAWVLPWMIKVHQEPSRAVFLEIGCGVGRFGYHIAPHVASYVGVDISSGMLARASDLMREIPNKNLVLGDGVSLQGLADRSVDLVFSYAVLQHIYEREVVLNYLRETVRVLRSAGSAKVQMLGSNMTPGLKLRWIRPRDVSDIGILRREAVRVLARLGLSRNLRIRKTSPLRRQIKRLLKWLPPDLLLPTFRYYRAGAGMRGIGISFRDAERMVRELGCDVQVEPFEAEPLARWYWLHIRKPNNSDPAKPVETSPLALYGPDEPVTDRAST